MSRTSSVEVVAIKPTEAHLWLLRKHYAKRLCPISYAFGAYRKSELIGVVTYGVPVSSNLRSGICGKKWAHIVLELNRLCCLNEKNLASRLIGASIAALPSPTIIISFADTGQGHIGYVYQATNFYYTGLSAKRTDWKIKGKEHLHGATVSDESRGQLNRAEWMRKKYGDAFYLRDRARKHRYFFIHADKRTRRQILNDLNYEIQPYPKGESRHYDVGEQVETQLRLT